MPVVVYFLSYIPFMLVPGPGHDLGGVIRNQTSMFDYHTELKATHPFSSTWWQWPLMKKPIWFYAGPDLPADKASSIVSMGNPAIWWVGILAVFAAMVFSIRKRDKGMFVVLIGLASQYLPWVLVPRLTFIYHFFASVPFVILCIVYLIMQLEKSYPKIPQLSYAYMAVVLILFAMFYPILSGAIVNKSYIENFLRWSNGWYFYS